MNTTSQGHWFIRIAIYMGQISLDKNKHTVAREIDYAYLGQVLQSMNTCQI